MRGVKVRPFAAVGRSAYTQTVVCEPEAARGARRLVAYAFDVWGLDALVDPAALCVSELVTNAVRHSGARIVEVSVTRPERGRVRIAVAERDHAVPTPGHGEPGDEGGRGLLLVDALADRWGADLGSDGNCVWCEFDADPRSRAVALPGLRQGGGSC